MSLSKCFLKCADNSHAPLPLPDGEFVTFGRGPDTKIKDSRCSRTQVKLKAKCASHEVEAVQIGRNACGVNGSSMKKDVPLKLKHGDRLEILLGQHIHVIDFNPPPPAKSDKEKPNHNNEAKSSASQSRTNQVSDSDEEDNEPLRKRVKVDDSKTSSNFPSSNWESIDGGKLLVYTPDKVKAQKLIAGYDLDGTIIGTKSGGVFPKNQDDWRILYPEVLSKLKDLHEKNYKILFFTNQAGISSGKTNINEFCRKIESIVKKLLVPIQVFIATGYSIYRKPCPGMWDAAMERNNGIEPDMKNSFYCGDAAGRDEGPRKKDFSQADLSFARNLNLNFETPEHHFLKKKMSALKVTVFDPNSIPCDIPLCEPSWGQVITSKTEVIVLVGYPGSGKSYFAKTHLIPAGYVHVNRDSLGSWNKCVAVTEQALRNKQRVVIDNTNPDVESRKRYIEVAKNFTSLVRCFIMNTSWQHVRHNNRFRQLTDTSHAAISDIVLHAYKNKYVEPSTTEGFSEVLKINFWPTFKNPKHEKLYKMFLLEK